MFNQTKLEISIDTLVLKLKINTMALGITSNHIRLLKKIFTDNNTTLNYDYISEQKHYTIYNQYNSGIASITYDLRQATTSIYTNHYITINLYGMRQVYNENNQIQQEHLLLIKWINQIKGKRKSVHIKKIDIALDHYNHYDNTIIKFGNNTEHQINQHKRKISTITKFKTHYIYIHKSETKLIKTITNQTKIKAGEKGNITDEYYYWVLDEWNGARTDKSEASHIKFIIKSENNYWKTYYAIYDQIENEDDITYSSFINNKVVISNRDKSALRIINYDKNDREIEKIKKEIDKNKHKRRIMFTQRMEEEAKNYNVARNKIGWNRTEITIRDIIDFEDLEERLKKQIKKLHIILFRSKTEREKYTSAFKKTEKTKLKDYKNRELKISDKEIDTLISNLKLLLFMGI